MTPRYIQMDHSKSIVSNQKEEYIREYGLTMKHNFARLCALERFDEIYGNALKVSSYITSF